MIFEFFIPCGISDADPKREALSKLKSEFESLVTLYKDNGVRLLVWARGGEALESWTFE
jgi:hypothetical protein